MRAHTLLQSNKWASSDLDPSTIEELRGIFATKYPKAHFELAFTFRSI